MNTLTSVAIWPALKDLYSKKVLPDIDFLFTCRLLQNCETISESVPFFLSHLSLASRQGHLCVRIDEDKVIPSVDQLWESSDELELTEEMLRMIEYKVREGASLLPKELMSDIVNEEGLNTPIGKRGTCYYFQKYWVYESSFLHSFKRLQNLPPAIAIDPNAVQDSLDKLIDEKLLLPEQAEAVFGACCNSLTAICGGPGTGKTYTAAYVIKTIWQLLPPLQKEGFEILLAAPTGKAAAQLQKSLSKVVDSFEGMQPLIAKTLHTLLGISKYKKNNDETHLAADLILVDECSMIDIKLMTALLRSIKPGARLIMLGDPYQLPPVEAGAVFGDMINVLMQKNGVPKPLFLKKCLRSELKGILALADGVRSGDYFKVMELLENKDTHGGVFFHEDVDLGSKKSLEWIKESVTPYYDYSKLNPNSNCSGCLGIKQVTHEDSLCFFNTFRLLTPLRRGLMGVEHLNRMLYASVLHGNQGLKEYITPIMIVSNHKGLNLFNGETGVLVTQSRTVDPHRFQKGDYAIFPEAAGRGFRKIPAALLPRFELAYCLSVHKSQGSEFDHVMLILPEGSEVFGREALYTAITRAKKELHIFSAKKTLEKTIQRSSKKVSGII